MPSWLDNIAGLFGGGAGPITGTQSGGPLVGGVGDPTLMLPKPQLAPGSITPQQPSSLAGAAPWLGAGLTMLGASNPAGSLGNIIAQGGLAGLGLAATNEAGGGDGKGDKYNQGALLARGFGQLLQGAQPAQSRQALLPPVRVGTAGTRPSVGMPTVPGLR